MEGDLFDSARYEPQQPPQQQEQQRTQQSTVEEQLALTNDVDWEDDYPTPTTTTTAPPAPPTMNGHQQDDDDDDDDGPSLHHSIDTMTQDIQDDAETETILSKGIAAYIKEKRSESNSYYQQEKLRIKAEEKKEKERKKRIKEKKKRKLKKKKEKAEKKREKAKKRKKSDGWDDGNANEPDEEDDDDDEESEDDDDDDEDDDDEDSDDDLDEAKDEKTISGIGLHSLAVLKRDHMELNFEEKVDPDDPINDFVVNDDAPVEYEDGAGPKRKLPDRKAKQDVLPPAVKDYMAQKFKAQQSKPSDLLPPPEDKEEYKTKPWNGDEESSGDDADDKRKKGKKADNNKKKKDAPSTANGDDKLTAQLKAAESYLDYLSYDGKIAPEDPKGRGYDKLWEQLKPIQGQTSPLLQLSHWTVYKLAVGAMTQFSYLPDYNLEGSHPARKPQPSVYDKAFSRWRVMYLKHRDWKEEQKRLAAAASRPIQRTMSGIHSSSSSPLSSPPSTPLPSSSASASSSSIVDHKLDLLLSRTPTPTSNGIIITTMKSSSSSASSSKGGKQWSTGDTFEFGIGITGKNSNGVRYGHYRIHQLGQLAPTVLKPLSILTKEINQEHYSTCLFLGATVDDKKKFIEESDDYSAAYRQECKGEAINRLELFVIPNVFQLTPAPLSQEITNRTEPRKGKDWAGRWPTIQGRDNIKDADWDRMELIIPNWLYIALLETEKEKTFKPQGKSKEELMADVAPYIPQIEWSDDMVDFIWGGYEVFWERSATIESIQKKLAPVMKEIHEALEKARKEFPYKDVPKQAFIMLHDKVKIFEKINPYGVVFDYIVWSSIFINNGFFTNTLKAIKEIHTEEEKQREKEEKEREKENQPPNKATEKTTKVDKQDKRMTFKSTPNKRAKKTKTDDPKKKDTKKAPIKDSKEDAMVIDDSDEDEDDDDDSNDDDDGEDDGTESEDEKDTVQRANARSRQKTA